MSLDDAVKNYLKVLIEREETIRVEGGNCSDWTLDAARAELGVAFAAAIGLPAPRDSWEIWTEEQQRRASLRRAPGEQLRKEIYQRDGFKCVSCGSTDHLSADHIVPFSKGGLTVRENLQTLCTPCNSRKKDRL